MRFLKHFFTYIRDDDMARLKTWKYKSCEPTPLDRLMEPWWTYCQTKVPKWASPNVVSLSGITLMFLVTCFVSAFSPHFESRLFCTLLAMVTMFIYQTLDAVDGKHARYLGMCSPFGSMLDHSCDALSLFCQAMLIVHNAKPDLQLNAVLFTSCMMALNVFFFVHWASRFEGELKVEGTTESQFVAIGLMTPNLFYNPEIWESETVNNCTLLIVGSITVFLGVVPIVRVIRKFGMKPIPLLLPILLSNLIAFYIFYSGNFHYSPKMTFGCIGMTVILTTLRFVIGNMANTPINLGHALIPVGVLLFTALQPQYATSMLALLSFLFLFVAVDTTVRVCDALNIPILAVKMKN